MAKMVVFNPGTEVIKRYDRSDTFFYIDPPYWDCEHYYGKGIFSREDFTLLANALEHFNFEML